MHNQEQCEGKYACTEQIALDYIVRSTKPTRSEAKRRLHCEKSNAQEQCEGKYACTEQSEKRKENHMFLNMLKGKIHRATVVQAEIDYVGSITIDEALMEAAGILEYERVQVVDVNNGTRLETYVIAGERGSGMICLNGAAAKLVEVGDKVIIMCYAQMTAEEFKDNPPKVVFVDDNNKINRLTRYEKHGLLEDME